MGRLMSKYDIDLRESRRRLSDAMTMGLLLVIYLLVVPGLRAVTT